MTSLRYGYSVVDEPSLTESINHPSFIKTFDSSSVSHVSSSSTSLARSLSKSPQVTGIRHPTTNSTEDASSAWSFQYDDFEQELLQDTSPPRSVSGNILASSKPTCTNHEQSQVPSATSPPPLDNNHDASTFLFDITYPPETRERIERSFNEQFGLQSSTSSTSRHSIISQHSSATGNSHVSRRHMTDMMENKCLQMQESLSSRLQILEDKLNRTHLESANSSQRSRSVLSREMDSATSVPDGNDGDQSQMDGNDNHGGSQQQQQQQQQQRQGGRDIDQTQRMMDLQHFVDRVEALVWNNTPFLSPADTMKSAHICDRHRAWSEQILRERQKTALDSLDARDRMEATLKQLIQWSDSIRKQQHHR